MRETLKESQGVVKIDGPMRETLKESQGVVSMSQSNERNVTYVLSIKNTVSKDAGVMKLPVDVG